MGLCLSMMIEETQLATHRGFFEIDDLILNTIGALIGYGIFSSAWKLFTKNNLKATDI